MAYPLDELAPRFRDAITRAFGAEHRDTDPMLRPSRFADYQANGALGLAKTLHRPPREVAQALLGQLDPSGLVAKTEIAGPGFINVWLSPDYLASELATVAAGDLGLVRASAPDTVVIDYSSPNVAKEMHVGHLRSTIIGDALARVFEALGHRVVRQNHLGDWGTPFGMLIEHLLDLGVDSAEQSVSDLNAFYQAARGKFDHDEDFAERSRRRVVLLQGGDEETLALWKQLVAASQRYFASVYSLLGVTLQEADVAGESLYNPLLAETVRELERLGLGVESDGAICVFPPGFRGRDEQPVPLIVRKRDGGYGYATTDLAAIRYRVHTLGASRVIYVVGAAQAQHLAMVFESGRAAGWFGLEVRTEHVAFGAVLGADKKMYKTRAGASVRLVDLLEEAVARAHSIVREKNPALDAAEQHAIARAVGIGAVKYADLSSDRVKDYVFDYDRMLAFDGNTGPYLQYAHARIRSIFRKGEVEVPSPRAIPVHTEVEKALGLLLLAFPSVVSDVAESLCPHKLCGYLYELAASFSTFYENCPVLKAETAELRASRLALCDLAARVLARGLGLLGIEAPPRM
ncbi:MAG: arginine--tRNA ligase [Polyangiaceae bacterium]|nr:arginine--tRNA ligase [Polyangiaceae bacterium]